MSTISVRHRLRSMGIMFTFFASFLIGSHSPLLAQQDGCNNMVVNANFASEFSGWTVTGDPYWTAPSGSGVGGHAGMVSGDSISQVIDTSDEIGTTLILTFSAVAGLNDLGTVTGVWGDQSSTIDTTKSAQSTSLSFIVTSATTTLTFSATSPPFEPQLVFNIWISAPCEFPTYTPTNTATATATEIPPTATSTSTSTPTEIPPTATNTSTSTPTEVPPTATNTSTSTPTEAPPTATSTSTSTPTEVPPSATSTSTSTPTEVPPSATSTSTSTPTEVPATSTSSPTDVPPTSESTSTSAPVGSGSAVITVVTENGNLIPDDTEVCLASQCQSLDAIAAASAPSGTSANFSDLNAGSYPLTVSVAGVIVHQETVVVTANATLNVTVVLPAVDAGTPSVVPVTPDPGPPPVTSLPSTGAGSDTSWAAYLVLLGGAALISLAGGLTWKQRRSR